MLQTQARRVVLRAGVSKAKAALAGRLSGSGSGLARPLSLSLTPPFAAGIHTALPLNSKKSSRRSKSKSIIDPEEEDTPTAMREAEGEFLNEEALKKALSGGEISLDEFERFESEMGFDDKDIDMNDPEAVFKAGVTEPQRVGETEAEIFGTESPSPLSETRLDPRNLPIPINDLSDLGPNFTEEAYASALIHGRSIHTPFVHPSPYHIPVASIQFLSHHPRLLALFTHFAMHAASSLGIPTSRGVVMLPTERRLWTVPRSPFVHKKSQENFERKTHKRMIKAWDADEEVVDRWIKYLKHHEMGGVGMRITRWVRVPVGFGRTRMEHVENVLRVPPTELEVDRIGVAAIGEDDSDVKLAELKDEVDSSANRKKAILALGKKIVKQETQGNVVDAKATSTDNPSGSTPTPTPSPKVQEKNPKAKKTTPVDAEGKAT